MREKLTIFFLFFLMICAGYSQELQDYQRIYEQSQDPAGKLVALDSILSITRKVDRDTFAYYSEEYINLALEQDSVEAAGKKLINAAYTLTSIKNQPRHVISLVDGILARRYKIDDSFVLGGLYLKRGGANYRLDLSEAVKDYEKAIEAFGPNDSLYIADAYLFSGQAYSNLGKFFEASENYRKAYVYFESLEDYEYMLYAQQGITTMWSMNGFQELAMEERESNIERIKELGLEHHLVTEYYNQALDYEKLGDYDSFFEYLLMAREELNQHQGQSTNGVLVNSKLVEYYSIHYKLEDAEYHLNAVKENYEESRGDNLIQSHYNGAQAAYNFALGDYEKALYHANEKLGFARSLDYGEDIMSAHQLLCRIYTEMGDYESSLEQKNAYMALKDSVYSRSAANSLAYYQTLYETTKKEKELVEQSSNIALLERNNAYFKNLTIAVSIISVMALGLFMVIRNQRSLKLQQELQEKFSQELLASQEEERLRISKDLHDGLGQQLLVLKNRLVDGGDEDTKRMVDQTIEEVRTISRDLHPFQLQEMGLTRALEHTVKQIDENTALFISSEIENIDKLFTPEQEVNIYRIVQESFSNIIKHAKAEAGKITVRKGKEDVSIVIKDNGVGFDFQQQYFKRNSMGLKTLMERTRFVNGQLKVHSRSERGTELEFKFPIG